MSTTGEFANKLRKNKRRLRPGGGGTPDTCQYGEAPPEKSAFFTLEVYERVGISRVEVSESVGKSVI